MKLLFICPHCDHELHIPPTYLGMKGRCNKCQGRIALIGNANERGPQRASVIEDTPPSGNGRAKLSSRQQALLEELGVSTEEAAALDKEQASALIRERISAKRHTKPATEKQIAYLKRLGAPNAQLEQVHTKEEAAQLIEEMHLQPTAAQMTYLRNLGANGVQLARLKTRGQASALIQELAGEEI